MHPPPSNSSGMPLVKIMIMAALLIAVFSFHKAWQTVCDSRFTMALRKFAVIFEQYPIFNGSFPPMAAPGVTPPGMEDLLRKTAWTNNTAMGGQWDWVTNASGWGWATNASGLGKGIRIYMPTVSEKRMKKIDDKIDDGNLHSGKFQILDDRTGYLYVIE